MDPGGDPRRAGRWRGSAGVTPISGAAFAWAAVVKIPLVFAGLLVLIAFWTLVERRVAGFIQNRLGPNRVGPAGLLQPVADGLKNMFKEETLPPFADRFLFLLAPLMAFVPALITFAIVPVAAPLPTRWGLVGTAIADLPVGFLYILAISSLGVYGFTLAGWASNNKYSLLGGLRASAQMISYEVSMGLSAVAVLVLAGSITLGEIVQRQQQSTWFVIPLFFAFCLFLVAAFAETNRLPFDLPEAEAELIAGYHTEYSAMKFSMFYLAEYSNMVTASALMASLFFGGWDIPFTAWDDSAPWSFAKTAATFVSFWTKTLAFMFAYIWVRWTLPRFRFDQLMDLGWKVMLPIALAYVMVIGVAVWALEALGLPFGTRYALALGALNLVAAVALFWGLDRRRLIGGAGARARGPWRAPAAAAAAARTGGAD
ncbi:MAG: NADH-quinone oxidoreductase subunit NuoH [Gemmatimonadetes bacterium]|nr:NADH-quinone oxidoreductase subunit NuoH [Gemmatimonadota bacterium]